MSGKFCRIAGMICYKCGKEKGDKLGLCDDCRSARSALPAREQPGPHFGRHGTDSFAPWLIYAAGAVLIMPLLLLLYSRAHPSLEKEWNGFSYAVSAGPDSRLVFSVKEPILVHGRIVSMMRSRQRLEEAGAERFLAYLTEDEWRQLEQITSRGRCPAGFLNAHAKNLGLVAGDAEVAKRVKSSSLDRGTKFTLSGELLQFTEGTYKGMPTQGLYGNVRFVHVNSFEAHS